MPSNPFVHELTEPEPEGGDRALPVEVVAAAEPSEAETSVEAQAKPAGDMTDSSRASGSVSIIKTPEDVPAAVERVTRAKGYSNPDLDWLLRRAGKKK